MLEGGGAARTEESSKWEYGPRWGGRLDETLIAEALWREKKAVLHFCNTHHLFLRCLEYLCTVEQRLNHLTGL
jgi:hypothetical protein